MVDMAQVEIPVVLVDLVVVLDIQELLVRQLEHHSPELLDLHQLLGGDTMVD